MKRKIVLVALIAAFLVGTLGCASGPKRLSRAWDDHVNQKYTEDSLIHGALLQDVIPVYGIVGLVAGIGDAFVNFYYFWWMDAWDRKGTGFIHDQPEASKTVSGSGLEGM